MYTRRTFICNVLTGILSSYDTLSQTATDDALKDFLHSLKEHYPQVCILVHRFVYWSTGLYTGPHVLITINNVTPMMMTPCIMDTLKCTSVFYGTKSNPQLSI